MSLIKSLRDKLLPKKRIPIKVRTNDVYDIQRDEYLMDLMDRLEKSGKTLDSDMYDKL